MKPLILLGPLIAGARQVAISGRSPMKRLVLAAALLAAAGSAWATVPQNLPTLGDWENWLIQTLTGSQGVPLATGASPAFSGACGATVSTITGGQAAGQFKAASACSATALVLTFPYSAPNGYTCRIVDITTPANATNQTATTATTATFTATYTLNDFAQFTCFAY